MNIQQLYENRSSFDCGQVSEVRSKKQVFTCASHTKIQKNFHLVPLAVRDDQSGKKGLDSLVTNRSVSD